MVGSSLRHIYSAKDLDKLADTYRHSTLAINFYTDWSTQCRIATKEFTSLCRDPVCVSLVAANCNADVHKDIVRRYSVDKVPTLLFLKNGNVVDRLEGFDPHNLKRKVLHYASAQYQHTYHLNASPRSLYARANALLDSTDMILFIDSFHSANTWEFYAFLDGSCATYDVFNVCLDLAIGEYLKSCWNITTYPQLFMFGRHVGNFAQVRNIKNDPICKRHFRKAVDVINKRRRTGVDPVAFAAHKVQKLLQENNIVVFLEEDNFKPSSCETHQVLRILEESGVNFKTCNVLTDIHVRRYVEDISRTCCFPQVFLNGQYFGSVRFLQEFKKDLPSIGCAPKAPQ